MKTFRVIIRKCSEDILINADTYDHPGSYYKFYDKNDHIIAQIPGQIVIGITVDEEPQAFQPS